MDYIELNIMGAVRIAPTYSLSETARKLGEALGDIAFREDDPGKYDEFPSYSAESAGLSFVLLGIPTERDRLPGAEEFFFLQIGMEFRAEVAHESCDASSYFAALIRAASDLPIPTQ